MKLKSLIYASALLFTVGFAGCQNATKSSAIKLTNNADSVSYSLGVLIGENTKQNMKQAPGVEQLNKEIIISAFETAFNGDSVSIKPEVANKNVQKFFAEVSKVEGEKNLKSGEDFLAENKTKPGVVTLPSGLQYEIIKEGNGPKPKETDKVKCNYEGKTIDGAVFDSSYKRGEPAVFPVNGVIKGWTEALQLMPVGSKWKLFIPASLAYGERGAGKDIKPNSTLVFEVELLDIEKK